MPSSTLWRVVLGVVFGLATINAVKTLRQPDAWEFFGVTALVLAGIGVIGTVAAMALVAYRRLVRD